MESNQKDVLYYEKLRTFFLGAIFFLLVALLCGAIIFACSLRHYEKQISNIVDRLETVSLQLEELDVEQLVKTTNELAEVLDAERIDEIIASLNTVAKQLSEVDWTELSGNINDVAATARGNLADAEEALTKLKDLDIETLNKSIQDLQNVIEPMSKLAGLFG